MAQSALSLLKLYSQRIENYYNDVAETNGYVFQAATEYIKESQTHLGPDETIKAAAEFLSDAQMSDSLVGAQKKNIETALNSFIYNTDTLIKDLSRDPFKANGDMEPAIAKTIANDGLESEYLVEIFQILDTLFALPVELEEEYYLSDLVKDFKESRDTFVDYMKHEIFEPMYKTYRGSVESFNLTLQSSFKAVLSKIDDETADGVLERIYPEIKLDK